MKDTKEILGRFQGSGKGFAFVVPTTPDPEGDWFIPPRATAGAWDGDTVAVVPQQLENRTAKVVSIVSRGNQEVTGVVRREGNTFWLTPDSRKLDQEIMVAGKTNGIVPGDQVAVAMTSYGTATTPPSGTLREKFGRGGTRTAATAAVLYHYDIWTDFPPAPLIQADGISQTVPQEEIDRREDLREDCIVTIDGASAKDLDDAVSLTTDEKGRLVLGVHIAHVSHYVNPKTPLDEEAFDRGTSVYFADQVVPMLPVALSNGICSLNPHVNRLTLSCFMTLDENCEVVQHRLAETVISTAARLTYDQVNTLLAGEEQGGDSPLAVGMPQAEQLGTLVKKLHQVAKVRQHRRKLRGALALESDECYFHCNEAGEPIAVVRRESGLGEGLIEECMLLANETVARHLEENKLPGVFRVHESPSGDKIQGLRTMLAPLGYDLKQGDNFHLQALLEKVRDTPQAGSVNMMVLRSLMKAKYHEENQGHFGLAAPHYCHFTSPIRRYPDLVTHRILTAWLQGDQKTLAAQKTFAPQAALQSSQREVAAVSAEREIVKFYMAQLMTEHIGEEFAGTVSGVTKFGIYVMLTNGIEGMVPVTSLPQDRYDYDGGALTLTGTHSKTVYSFGTTLAVTCIGANPGSGEITLGLVGVPVATPRIPIRKPIPRPPQSTKRGPAPKKKRRR